MLNKCSVETCSKEIKNKKWQLCLAHAHKMRRYGDPLVSKVLRQNPECSVEGCSRKPMGRNLCVKHYWRLQRYGDPNIQKPRPPRNKDLLCAIEGCGKQRRSREWCEHHYKRWQAHGDPNHCTTRMGCSIEGCDRKHEALGLCDRHYRAQHLKNNPESLEAKRAAWARWANKPEVKARQRAKRIERYNDNLEFYRKKGRDYFRAHRESISKQSRKYREGFHFRFMSGLRAAFDTNREWTIEPDQFVTLLSQPCYYCGMSSEQETGYWLDRKDPAMGYTLDNVLPCCGNCNRLKNALITPEEMTQVIAVLRQMRGKQHVWQ